MAAPEDAEDEDEDEDEDDDEEDDEEDDEDDEDEEDEEDEEDTVTVTDAAADGGGASAPPQALRVRLTRTLATERAMAGRYARVMRVLYIVARREKYGGRWAARAHGPFYSEVLLQLINNKNSPLKNSVTKNTCNRPISPLPAQGFIAAPRSRHNLATHECCVAID